MRKLTNVQHLRAVAALIVLITHQYAATVFVAARSHRSFDSIPLYGTFGVDIFFVISGFIMFYTASNEFGGGVAATDKFIRRRLIRVVPIYWLLTMAMAALRFFQNKADSAPALVQSLLFIPFVAGNGKFRPVLGVGWSLNYEMLFYAIFAVGLLLPRRSGVFMIFMTLMALITAGSLFALPPPFSAWTKPIIGEFLLGVILGIAYVDRPDWFNKIRIPPLPVIVAIVCTLFYFYQPDGIKEGSLLLRPLLWVTAMLVVLIALLCENGTDPGLISRTMTRIGDSSYSLYLTHPVAGAVLTWLLLKLKLAYALPLWPFFFYSLNIVDGCNRMGLSHSNRSATHSPFHTSIR